MTKDLTRSGGGETGRDGGADAEAWFARALDHHRAGRLGEAEGLYRRVLAESPCHAAAIHLLGVIAIQAGRPDLGAAIIGEAIAIDPDAAPFRSDLGNALVRLGRLDAAVAAFRQAVALDPSFAEAHNNLGNALRLLRRRDEAAACYRQAIALRPDLAEPRCGLGIALYERGEFDAAAASLNHALTLRPDFPEAWVGLGKVRRDQRRLEEAEACCRRAVDLRPSLAEAWTGLGHALRAQGRISEAVDCHRRAVALAPDAAEAHNGLGIALHGRGEAATAAECYRRALDLNPDYPQAASNLGVALQELGDTAGAGTCHRRALALQPDNAETHNNLAYALLLRGDLEEGWREYEWRWQTAQMAAGAPRFRQPRWRGEAAEGRTLLVHAEQGYGDTLQFCRYAPLVAAAGLRVVLVVQAPLVRLLGGLPGVERVVGLDEVLPPFDLYCPLLSLPLALGTTLDTIPAAPSYLRADPVQAAAWGRRLAEVEGVRVGLVWAGSPRSHAPLKTLVDRRRSMAPALLEPLLEVPGLRLFSLQKDGPAAPADWPLLDFMGEMGDFADTAALVAHLDLVISVDTAVAHLAAALGKPVWLLNRFDTCWRWLLHRADSPWYPSLRQFRQPSPGDWRAVVRAVEGELRRLGALNQGGNTSDGL